VGSGPALTEALAWAADATGVSGVHVVRELLGGTHAVTHLLASSSPPGEMVLRRYPPGDRAVEREVKVLSELDGLDGWAPRLLAADPTGRRFGEPAILITRLPGHADIRPVDPHVAARELGRALARVHAVPPSTAGNVLTHHDYWSGNVLWEGPVLTGIVDWSGATRAPRGADLGWCRLDLYLLHDSPTADVFLAAYEEAAKVTVPDILRWDRFALAASARTVETWEPNYRSLGRLDLTAAKLRARHTQWATGRSLPPGP
jgi:aminoglycoside phosphotransferase (APT) family kinase protein